VDVVFADNSRDNPDLENLADLPHQFSDPDRYITHQHLVPSHSGLPYENSEQVVSSATRYEVSSDDGAETVNSGSSRPLRHWKALTISNSRRHLRPSRPSRSRDPIIEFMIFVGVIPRSCPRILLTHNCHAEALTAGSQGRTV